MQELWHNLQANPFFSGGAVLMIAGAILASLRHWPGQIWDWLKARLIVTVTINNDDEAFNWINYWLSKQPYSQRTRRLTAFSVRGEKPFDFDGRASASVDGRRGAARLRLAPAPGRHLFFHKGRLLVLDRVRNDRQPSSADLRKKDEKFEISMLARHRTAVLDLLEEARALALPSDDFIEILISSYSSWQVGFRQPRRHPETLVLPNGMWEDIRDDARRFLAGQAWYERHGIPHRRGYLLHGPPGSGKTSLVKVLASELDLDIALLNLNRMELDDESLLSLLSDLQHRRAILLLEDIDAIFQERKRTADANRSGVTFSGLLNALDGVGSAQRMLVVMTTNHLDQLDPALVRPGRADRKFAIGYAGSDEARRLWQAMLPEHPALADRFADSLVNDNATIADLQGILLRHRLDPPGVFSDAEAQTLLRGVTPAIGNVDPPEEKKPRASAAMPSPGVCLLNPME